jgi:ankyrin repeat protein
MNEKEPIHQKILSTDEQELFDAVGLGNLSTVNRILQNTTNLERLLIAQHTIHGGTVLHVAASSGNVDLVERLLDAGADINARAANLTTPLMWAAIEGDKKMCSLLCTRGADITATARTWKSSVFGRNSGFTAVHFASEIGHTEIVELLTSISPITVVQPDERMQTPIEVATSNGNDDIGDLLRVKAQEEYVGVRISVGPRLQKAIPRGK